MVRQAGGFGHPLRADSAQGGSAVGYDEYGREIFGNLCRHWTMRPNDAGTESSDLWEGFGRWFVRKEAAARKSPIRAMEQCR